MTTIERDELESLYWGPNKIPPEWKSIAEVAKELKQTASYITKVMGTFGITIRLPHVDAHKRVWEILETCFRMVPQIHFLYQTEVNLRPVDFFIVSEAIGIIIDPLLPDWKLKTLHVGNGMIVKIGCDNPSSMSARLEKQLRDLGVCTRYVNDTEEDDEGIW